MAFKLAIFESAIDESGEKKMTNKPYLGFDGTLLDSYLAILAGLEEYPVTISLP